MSTSPRARGSERSGLHLAVIVFALLVTLYLAFQIVGFLFRLAFLCAVALLGLAAWRAWRRSP